MRIQPAQWKWERRHSKPQQIPAAKFACFRQKTRFAAVVTDHARQQEKLRIADALLRAHVEQLAYHDMLTGLPNRSWFMHRLEQALARNTATATHPARQLAILLLDLNGFKEINETLGHSVGDQVLVKVARRFKNILREEEALARLGGDEFAVMAAVPDRDAAVRIATRLQQALATPIATESHFFAVDAGIGIAFYPSDGSTVEDLLKRADIAMYRAKAAGGGHLFYRPEMSAGLENRLQIAKNLDRAMQAGELHLYYQPKIDLNTGKLSGAEALLRWNDPERGWISPGEFIPIAESRGIMPALGNWVLQEACRQISTWEQAGLHFPGRLAVNVAAQQFEESGFAGNLIAIVRAAGLTPSVLDLELTESGLMGNVERAITVMHTLRQAGFSLSIDDFGTGYSSLSYLKRLPADALKIDISFVRDMLKERHDYVIVNTIIGMARNLGLKAIAEGVEVAAQSQALLALGCDEAQGYYFGRPEPADQFEKKWLRDRPRTKGIAMHPDSG